VANPDLRLEMGLAGRQRVMQDFKPQVIWEALLDNYKEMMKFKGLNRL
jgi:glycosyltransferase involved in cell wall biosynthesis